MGSSAPYNSEVYCVVVTYNGSQWIRQCLGSLLRSSFPLNIIVVDNNSKDDTVEIIREDFAQVDLILCSENLGFGKANNVGISKAISRDAEFVFLLNQDAWVEADTVEKLITALQKNAQYGTVSPLHYAASGKNLDKGFHNYLLREYSQNEIDVFIDHRSSEIKEISFANAAAWLISRRCLEKVGGFNPLFFLYGEDNEYVNRLKFHDFKLGILPGSKMYHDREARDESSSFESQIRITRYYQIKMIVRLTDANQRFVLAQLFAWIWLSKETLFHLFWKGRLFALPAFFKIFFYSISMISTVVEMRNKIETKNSFLFLTPGSI